MKIAIQGEVGSFHDSATQSFFANIDYDLVPCANFSEVFNSLSENKSDYGVVAVENSLFGSIHETYDNMLRHDFTIIGEAILPIHQQLLANTDTKLDDITEVISHPAALDQCREYIRTNLPNAEIIEHPDTAGAARDVAKSGSKYQVAIASLAASEIYGLNVLAKNIEDQKDNVTRFVVIKKHPEYIENANKASVILTTPHKPGSLLYALEVFAKHNVNLTKIESRPVRGKPFQYQFIIDLLADQKQLVSTIHELEQINSKVQLLGHYRSATIN